MCGANCLNKLDDKVKAIENYLNGLCRTGSHIKSIELDKLVTCNIAKEYVFH